MENFRMDEQLYQYTLMNKSGTTMKVINFGAIVTSLLFRIVTENMMML